jgi:hypothetical protein
MSFALEFYQYYPQMPNHPSPKRLAGVVAEFPVPVADIGEVIALHIDVMGNHSSGATYWKVERRLLTYAPRTTVTFWVTHQP